jgi:hypothetical protein
VQHLFFYRQTPAAQNLQQVTAFIVHYLPENKSHFFHPAKKTPIQQSLMRVASTVTTLAEKLQRKPKLSVGKPSIVFSGELANRLCYRSEKRIPLLTAALEF